MVVWIRKLPRKVKNRLKLKVLNRNDIVSILCKIWKYYIHLDETIVQFTELWLYAKWTRLNGKIRISANHFIIWETHSAQQQELEINIFFYNMCWKKNNKKQLDKVFSTTTKNNIKSILFPFVLLFIYFEVE